MSHMKVTVRTEIVRPNGDTFTVEEVAVEFNASSGGNPRFYARDMGMSAKDLTSKIRAQVAARFGDIDAELTSASGS